MGPLSWLTHSWGPIDVLESPRFDFAETGYYLPTMGGPIQIVLWAFERLVDPAELVPIKLQANDFEAEYTGLGRHPEPRPLNLDPGYVTSAKLVLASTKDHAHRIYLSRGIFAEVTLYYKDRRWQHREFSRSRIIAAPTTRAFFSECREYLRSFPLRLKDRP